MFSSDKSNMNRSVRRALYLVLAAVSELQSREAILRRIILVAIALGLPLAFFSTTYPLSPFLTVGLAVGLSSLFTAMSWLKEERLKGIYVLPFDRRSVKAAVCIVGISSAIVSDVVPIALAFYLTASISTVSALLTVVVGISAATFAFTFVALIHPIGATMTMNAKALRGKMTIRKEASVQTKERHEGGPSSLHRFLQDQVFLNYFLTSICRNAQILISILVLTAIGIIATDAMLGKGVPYPIHSICIALAPTLSTLLSRNRDTRRQMLTLENKRVIVLQYLIALLIVVLPLILIGDALLSLFGRTITIEFAVASVAAYLAASIVIVVLEMFFPILNWKTENEMYRHPRRYLPMLVAFLVAGFFYLIQ